MVPSCRPWSYTYPSSSPSHTIESWKSSRTSSWCLHSLRVLSKTFRRRTRRRRLLFTTASWTTSRSRKLQAWMRQVRTSTISCVGSGVSSALSSAICLPMSHVASKLWRITMSSTDLPDSFCTRTAMEHTSSCKWRDTKCALYIYTCALTHERAGTHTHKHITHIVPHTSPLIWIICSTLCG